MNALEVEEGRLKLTTFNGAVGQPAANTAVHFTHPRLCMRLHCLHELGFLLGVKVPDMPAGSWIEVDSYELKKKLPRGPESSELRAGLMRSDAKAETMA